MKTNNDFKMQKKLEEFIKLWEKSLSESEMISDEGMLEHWEKKNGKKFDIDKHFRDTDINIETVIKVLDILYRCLDRKEKTAFKIGIFWIDNALSVSTAGMIQTLTDLKNRNLLG